MIKFEFDDISFFIENHDGEFPEAAQEYLDEHLKLAYEHENFTYLMDCYQSKSNLYLHFDDFENVSKCHLKMFSLGANPIYYDGSGYALPLSKPVIESLIDLSEAFGKNHILQLFDEVWDEMDFKVFIVDKKEVKNILKDLLDNCNVYEYNDYLYESAMDFHN